jgi:hypothetical protein
MILPLTSCHQKKQSADVKIVFLHHSTGRVIWRGSNNTIIARGLSKASERIADFIDKRAALPKLFKKYNKAHGSNYSIVEIEFPSEKPYGWKNYPYDYYNTWVKNAGNQPFMDQPTLEILTKNYKVIIFKHCFPVSNIEPDLETPDINSEEKTISNYKLQYLALKDKLHEFPDNKFILFTGAVQVKANIQEDEALRTKEFFSWVTNEWDIPDDNIYIWDLYSLQTEGGLYFSEKYAVSSVNSHPNKKFAGKAVELLYNRIIDVIENNGNNTTLTGEKM